MRYVIASASTANGTKHWVAETGRTMPAVIWTDDIRAAASFAVEDEAWARAAFFMLMAKQISMELVDVEEMLDHVWEFPEDFVDIAEEVPEEPTPKRPREKVRRRG